MENERKDKKGGILQKYLIKQILSAGDNSKREAKSPRQKIKIYTNEERRKSLPVTTGKTRNSSQKSKKKIKILIKTKKTSKHGS